MNDDLDDLIRKRRAAAAAANPDPLDALIAQQRAAAPKRPGLGERVMSGIGGAVSHMVQHPIETAKSLVTAPLKSAADAFLTPEVGEQRPDPKLVAARFGGIPKLRAPAYDAEHGAQPVGGRTSAGLQTVANVAFPGIARGVSTRLATAGLPAIVARGGGMAAGGGMAGAAYSPDDPLAGGIAGAFLAPVVGETIRGAGKLTGKAITATGLRPSGRSAIEMAMDAATMREPVGPQAGAASPTIRAANDLPPLSSTAPTNAQRLRAVFGSGVEAAGVESAKTRALRLVDHRFDLDNVTPADAVAYVRQNPSKPLAALDLGEGNVAGLARLSKDVPGLGRKIIPKLLHDRSSGNDGATLKRVTQDIENRIGLEPENYYETVGNLVEQQKAMSKPAYDKVRDLTIDDPEVISLFDIPKFRFAHRAVAEAEGIRPNGMKIKPLSEKVELGGEVSRVQNPQTLGTLDKMRQYIGDIARGKLESKRIDKNTARAMLERLDAATQRLDELHPDYAEARAGYSGRARMMDAVEAGKADFLTKDPREIQSTLAKMSEGEADLYRRGAYDELRAKKLLKMEDGSNIGAFLEKNPDIRERIAALAKRPEDAAALRGDLGVEKAMGDRKNYVLGGPNSAERMIEHGETAQHLSRVATGGIKGVAVRAAESVLNRTTREGTADVMGEVAKYLTRSGPEGVQTLLDEIAALKAADKRAASIPRLKTGYAAATRSGQKPKRD